MASVGRNSGKLKSLMYKCNIRLWLEMVENCRFIYIYIYIYILSVLMHIIMVAERNDNILKHHNFFYGTEKFSSNRSPSSVSRLSRKCGSLDISQQYCTILGVLDQFWSPIVLVTPLNTPCGLLISLLQSQSHVTTTAHNYFSRCAIFTQLTITYTVVTTITYNTITSLH
jgi:hypothetical protein